MAWPQVGGLHHRYERRIAPARTSGSEGSGAATVSAPMARNSSLKASISRSILPDDWFIRGSAVTIQSGPLSAVYFVDKLQEGMRLYG